MDHLPKPEGDRTFHLDDVFELKSLKQRDELLVCVASSEKSIPGLIASTAVPDEAILIFMNVRFGLE